MVIDTGIDVGAYTSRIVSIKQYSWLFKFLLLLFLSHQHISGFNTRLEANPLSVRHPMATWGCRVQA